MNVIDLFVFDLRANSFLKQKRLFIFPGLVDKLPNQNFLSNAGYKGTYLNAQTFLLFLVPRIPSYFIRLASKLSFVCATGYSLNRVRKSSKKFFCESKNIPNNVHIINVLLFHRWFQTGSAHMIVLYAVNSLVSLFYLSLFEL